jgi:hypothetical protein
MENSFFHSNQSGKPRVGFAFILGVALGSCVITELRAQLVVAPNEMATIDGNSSIVAPAGPGSGIRYMQIFDASQFGSLSGPSLLTQVALRPDTTSSPLGRRTFTYRVYASTTSRSVAGLSTTFADNLGTNNTLVFNGTFTQRSENLPGPGDTRQFDILYPFTTPFLYDPSAGNLLLDYQFDAATNEGAEWDAVTENPTTRGIIGVGSPNARTGQVVAANVTQFTFAAPALATIRASQVEVCWNSQSNLTYQVQYRSDLTTNLWTSLVDCVRSTNSTTCLYDPVVAGQPLKFYRVLLTS